MNRPFRHHELFQSKSLRDIRAKELKLQLKCAVKRASVRGQQLHPQYVEDLKDTPEGLQRGFGNTVYGLVRVCATLFAVLYEVSWQDEPDPQPEGEDFCRMWLSCTNKAVAFVQCGPLGMVPSCQRCKDKYDRLGGGQ